jgi:hypothetical protein
MNNVALTLMAQTVCGPNSAKVTLEIYSGTMPVVTENYAYAATNHASQLLAKFAQNTTYLTGVSPGIARLTSPWSPVNATATGTATWFAIYGQGNVAVIGSVTDAGPNIAPVYINSLNIVAGSPVNLIQFGLKLSF